MRNTLLSSTYLFRVLSAGATSFSRPQLQIPLRLHQQLCPNPRAFSLFSDMASAAGPAAPVPPHDFKYTAERIAETAEKHIKKTRALEDRIGALKANDCTFESVVLALAHNEVEFDTDTDPATFMQSVSTEKGVRDAATDASKKISDFGIESSMRKDIYEALTNVQKNTPAGQLDAPSQRLLDRMLRDKRRAGLGLPDDKQATFKDLKSKISKLCIEFMKNCDEEKGYLLFSATELDGLPEAVLAGLETVDQGGEKKYKVTHKTPDVLPLLKFAKNPETRRSMYLSYENRSTVNTPLFKQIMELRKEAAAVVGYPTWADYIIEPKMAKTGKTVQEFLDDLYTKIKPIGEKEKRALLELKKEDCDAQGIPFSDALYAWDYRYLDRLFVEKNFQLNDELVKQYLPVAHVVQKVLDIYQRILSVRIIQAKDAPTWHEEVSVFSVWDALDDGQQEASNSSFLGYLYLDLYPREDKYGHAAVWGLIPGSTLPDGSRQHPIAGMVANLAKPAPGRPALLTHDDTVTFFHEMGHAFHGLLSKTKYGRFHGTSVVRDFVECPSQMLENWCFYPKVLKEISSHHKTGEAMPDDLVDKIIKSQFINQALFNLRQLYFGRFDMAVHAQQASSKPLDYTQVWNDLREEVALTSLGDAKLPEGQSSFAHLVGGYDAGYYGYLYSQSFSVDMFETVFEKDPLSAEAGLRYRREILQPGGEREEMDSLTRFLGRPPSNEAFMKKLLRGA